MGVRKRYSKWWVDFSFKNERYRRPSPENSRAGALAYEAVLRQKLSRGEPLEKEETKGSVLFKDFAADWFKTYVKNNNKPSEVRSKESMLRVHIVPFFGNIKLEKIGNLEIEKFKSKKIEERLNPKTINNHLTVLRKCLNTAVDWEMLDFCPAIKALKTLPQKFDFLSEDECSLLVNSAQGIYRDMIILALGTGLRFGELVALKWEDVDFKNNEITVSRSLVEGILGSTKSNRIRRIPMTDSVLESLKGLKKENGFIFTNRNENPVVRRTCVRVLRRACREAGIRNIGWHVLRHTFASHLAQAGANLVAVQNLLGHSEIRTTMRYAHIDRNVLVEAINVLNSHKSTREKFPVTILSQV
jgi:integrase